VIALGSGTSGGTLAPLFTIGGGLGAALGSIAAHFAPSLGIDPRVAGLVGMAAIFAGSSRAMLASVVFAFETTRQPMGLLPLLGGCAAAYLISCLMMRHSIMTVKIARRGVRVPSEYRPDTLDGVSVAECASRSVVALDASDTIDEVRAWLASGAQGSNHRGFPVVNDEGELLGVITRKDIETLPEQDARPLGDVIRREAVVAFDDESLRDAAERMARAKVGQLPVVERDSPRKVVGILTADDFLIAYRRRIDDESEFERTISLNVVRLRRTVTERRSRSTT
jgi:CBS domain-containing protein